MFLYKYESEHAFLEMKFIYYFNLGVNTSFSIHIKLTLHVTFNMNKGEIQRTTINLNFKESGNKFYPQINPEAKE